MITSETWRPEKGIKVDQNSWIKEIYEMSIKYEWTCPS